MAHQQPETQSIQQLQLAVSQLQGMLRRLQSEREQAARRRRKRLLIVAVPISLAIHMVLMIYLALMSRDAGTGEAGPVGVEFAIVHSEDLATLDELDFSEFELDAATDLDAITTDASAMSMQIAVPSVELTNDASRAVESLGGAGEGLGSDSTLTSGGATTSYFGIASRGTRFAYIIDRSGSMSHRSRMQIAMAELVRSLQALPDYAFLHIVFFSSETLQPPMQSGWVQARRSNLTPLIRWLNMVDPGGGTMPGPAFHQVFAMDVRPDVIYFMTDGMISGFRAEEVASLNRTGKRVTIHTIAFGDQGSEELLRQIARDSGGTYRYVPDRGEQP